MRVESFPAPVGAPIAVNISHHASGFTFSETEFNINSLVNGSALATFQSGGQTFSYDIGLANLLCTGAQFIKPSAASLHYCDEGTTTPLVRERSSARRLITISCN